MPVKREEFIDLAKVKWGYVIDTQWIRRTFSKDLPSYHSQKLYL